MLKIIFGCFSNFRVSNELWTCTKTTALFAFDLFHKDTYELNSEGFVPIKRSANFWLQYLLKYFVVNSRFSFELLLILKVTTTYRPMK